LISKKLPAQPHHVSHHDDVDRPVHNLEKNL